MRYATQTVQRNHCAPNWIVKQAPVVQKTIADMWWRRNATNERPKTLISQTDLLENTILYCLDKCATHKRRSLYLQKYKTKKRNLQDSILEIEHVVCSINQDRIFGNSGSMQSKRLHTRQFTRILIPMSCECNALIPDVVRVQCTNSG